MNSEMYKNPSKDIAQITQDMMLGIAIGDAFGAGYEFAFKNRQDFSHIDLSRYRAHNHPDFVHEPGMYTDDTQMSIAVAELLRDGLEFNRKNLADYFVKCYKRDSVVGYAKGFKIFLESVSSGQELLDKIRPDSERNGAAMRSVPLGIIDDLETIIEYSKINASITHNTPKGIASSTGVALISHLNLYEGKIPDLEKKVIPILRNIDNETAEYLEDVCFAEKHLRKTDMMDYELLLGKKHKDSGVPCDGMRTLGAVVYILSRYDNPLDVLVESIKLGGDTDSVASIALGINLMHNDVSNIPENLYFGLTNHEFGRNYLMNLGKDISKIIPGNFK